MLRRLVLLTVSMLAAGALGEGLVRLATDLPRVHALWISDSESAYRRSENPLLRYELKPNFAARLEPGWTTTNAHGLRDRERSRTKPEGVRRILLVGDSVVELVNYLADEDTTARRLEQRYPGGDVEVINLSTSGYCTLAEIELLETRGLAFDPDVVVVVFVHNDFLNFNPEHTLESAIRRPWIVKQLFLRSHVFRLAALRFDLWSFGREAHPEQDRHQAPGENNVVTGLRRLRLLAREHGFMPLIAIWPGFGEREIVDGPWMPEGGELIVERLARMNGIPVARLSSAFPRVADPRARYTARGDGMHPSAEGARVAAAALEALIARLPAELPQPGEEDLAAVEAARRAGSEPPPAARPMKERIFFVLMQQYRVDEAEAYLRQLLAADADDAFARHRLGAELLRRKEVSAAIVELEHAARVAPRDVEILLRLGVAYAEKGDWDAAERQYERVLSLEPDHRGARADLEQIRRLRAGER